MYFVVIYRGPITGRFFDILNAQLSTAKGGLRTMARRNASTSRVSRWFGARFRLTGRCFFFKEDPFFLGQDVLDANCPRKYHLIIDPFAATKKNKRFSIDTHVSFRKSRDFSKGPAGSGTPLPMSASNATSTLSQGVLLRSGIGVVWAAGGPTITVPKANMSPKNALLF